MDRDEIIRVFEAFEASGLEYVLIGAAAMGFHGRVRATEDLDLLIRATPENIERLRAALRNTYDNDPHIDEISSTDLLGEYPAIRYLSANRRSLLRCAYASPRISAIRNCKAEIKEIEGTHVSVATPAALYR